MNTINIGDEVQLNSGGPVMTVKEFRDEDNVRGIWFDENGELKQADFPLKSVQIFISPY